MDESHLSTITKFNEKIKKPGNHPADQVMVEWPDIYYSSIKANNTATIEVRSLAMRNQIFVAHWKAFNFLSEPTHH
jgi:hypothetical protein